MTMLTVNLHPSVIPLDIPRVVWENPSVSGEYLPWAVGDCPISETAILWTINADMLTGVVTPYETDAEFGPVPELAATADITFSAGEIAIYPAVATITSGEVATTADLVGEVYGSGYGLRLDSNSKGRFGLIRAGLTDVTHFSSDSSSELKTYDPKWGAIVLENDSELYFWNNGTKLFTHRLTGDPLPYFNVEWVGVGIVAENVVDTLTPNIGILTPEEERWLIYETPLYVSTGELSIHALLALLEVAIEYNVESDWFPKQVWEGYPRSWRCKKGRTLEDAIPDNLLEGVPEEGQPSFRIKYAIKQLLDRKALWKQIMTEKYLLLDADGLRLADADGLLFYTL